jgi:hypothetical protein
MTQLGKLLVGIGLVLFCLGVILWLWGDKLSWIGRLPGDIRIEQPGFSFYFPITTMVLVSIVGSGVMWAIGKIMEKI